MDSLLLFGSQWVDKNPATHNGWCCLGPVDSFFFCVDVPAQLMGEGKMQDATCQGVGAFFGEEPLNF